VRILESEGLVTVARGARGGARISSPNFEMIQRAFSITLQAQQVTIGDVYEMYTLFEPPAARLVAERHSEAAVPLLRAIVEKEMSLVNDRFSVIPVMALFHRTLIEMAGNKTLMVIHQALRALSDAHMSLAQRRSQVDPKYSERQLRFGFKSHARLIDLIEAKDGPGAEAHWRNHMIEAGKVWMAKIGSDSIVDLID
jgi:DNA-binding FadR family transcriptional regulator